MGYHLYRRKGSDIWYLRPYRISTGCRDRRAAELWARQHERGQADPAHRAAKETTLEAAFDGFIAGRVTAKRAPKTIEYYEEKRDSVLTILDKDAPLARLTRADVRGLVDRRRADGASQHTIHKEIGALKSALRWARAEGLLHVAPESLLPEGLGVGYKPKRNYLTVEQAWALVRALERSRPEGERQPKGARGRAAHAAYLFATAARRSEAARARRADVDLAAKTARVRGSKTDGSDRLVPIVSATLPFLRYALDHAPGGSEGPLFRPWGNLWRDMNRACKRAGVPGASPNDLRRSLGSWLYQAGVPLERIAEVLRHSSIEMARRVYAVPSPATTAAVIERHLAAAKAPKGRRKAG